MNRIVFLILVLFSTRLIYSEKIEYDKSPREFVVDVPGETKDGIYKFIKTWIIKNFNWKNENLEKAKAMGGWASGFFGGANWKTTVKDPNTFEILEENKDLYRVKLNCYHQILKEYVKGSAFKTVSFSCQVDVKDGKYKVLFSDIIMKDWQLSMNAQNTYEVIEKKVSAEVAELMTKYIENSAQDLKAVIEKEKTNNW